MQDDRKKDPTKPISTGKPRATVGNATTTPTKRDGEARDMLKPRKVKPD